mgnify:CR=1 FL=1
MLASTCLIPEDLAEGTETDAAREDVATLLGSRERLEAFLERSADLLDNLRASLDHTKTESATLTSNRGALDDRLSSARARHQELLAELESVREGLKKKEEAHTAADSHRDEAEQNVSQLRQDLLRTISTLTGSRNRLGELEREQDRLDYSLGQLEQGRDRLAARKTEFDERLAAAVEASQKAVARVEELEDARRELVDERSRLADYASEML